MDVFGEDISSYEPGKKDLFEDFNEDFIRRI
jgi:hypothetical protein